MERAMKKYRRILFATDFSSAGLRAQAEAVALAKSEKGQLFVAHVLPSVGYAAAGFPAYADVPMYAEMERAIRRRGQRQLDAVLSRIARRGVRARGLLLAGLPHEEIVAAARKQRADLIVLGTHGRTGFSRLLVGSVAARVIVRAPCPVLTVR
jgi:nucleotide-binding universal stress UspA family protein